MTTDLSNNKLVLGYRVALSCGVCMGLISNNQLLWKAKTLFILLTAKKQ